MKALRPVALAALVLLPSIAFLSTRAVTQVIQSPCCAPAPVVPRVETPSPPSPEVAKALSYLVEHQGEQGGFGLNDGNDPDVANTAIAALALLQAGHSPEGGAYRDTVRRAIEFVLREVEAAPVDGPRVTAKTDTQPQRKVGPNVDTYLSGMLLARADGRMGSPDLDKRVRTALEKCVKKTESCQQPDGSWNEGGWAPVLGSSFAQQCLALASDRGVKVDDSKLEKAKEYAVKLQEAGAQRRPESAGVELYANNASLVMANFHVDDARERQAVDGATKKLGDVDMLRGFGSNGGEEYVSYMMASTALAGGGGDGFVQWDRGIRDRLAQLQNADGSWAGHHCITGRVFCTSSAVLTLTTSKSSEPEVARVK